MNMEPRRGDQVVVVTEGLTGKVLGVNTDPITGHSRVRCLLDDGTSWTYPITEVERTGRRYGRVGGEWTDKSYPALIEDQRWNGFAVPLFDLETAQLIVEDQAANPRLTGPEEDRLEWSGDSIVMTRGAYPDEPPEVIEPTEDRLYAIGALVWAWEEAQPGPTGSEGTS